MTIVDAGGLAEVLKCSIGLLRKVWREYPHFFIGIGRDLRGARFDVDDVLAYLKERGNYGSLEEQEGMVGGQIQPSRQTLQKRGVQDQAGGGSVGSKQAARGKCPTAQRDPYALLPGAGDRVSRRY